MDNNTDALANLIATVDTEVEAAGPRAGRFDRFVLFSLGAARYAVPITQVMEVASLPALTPVPHTPDWLLGVTNLRGEILSVIDLGRFFSAASSAGTGGRMLVVRGNHDEPFTGLVVDAVLGQTSLVAGSFVQPAAPITDPVMRFLEGVAEARGEAVGVLDLNRVVAAAELANQ